MENVVSGAENIEPFSSPIHGNGLRAKKTFHRGDILFYEIPWLFLQSTPNKQDALVCANCACFVGSLGTQMGLLDGTFSRRELLNDNLQYDGDFSLTPIVHCNNHCGEVYCSDSCRDNHYFRGHSMLCTGLISDEEADAHPLIQFKVFSVRTNEIFLLVGDIFAAALAAIDRHPPEEKFAVLEYHLEPFESFIRELWWDVARNPNDNDLTTSQLTGQALIQAKDKIEKSDADAQAVLRDLLVSMVYDAYSLMKVLFELEERGISNRLSAEYISRTIGMFEQNNVGVRLENPLVSYVKSLDENSPELPQVLSSVQRIVGSLEGDGIEEMEEVDTIQEHEGDEDMDGLIVEVDDGEGESYAKVLSDGQSQFIALKEVLDEYDENILFPPLDGTSFYTTICLMNHSCQPNVLIEYVTIPKEGKVGGVFNDSLLEYRGNLRRGLCAQVRVLRDISPGEEVFQSYIDINLDFKGRQDSLLDYGIECKCERCRDDYLNI